MIISNLQSILTWDRGLGLRQRICPQDFAQSVRIAPEVEFDRAKSNSEAHVQLWQEASLPQKLQKLNTRFWENIKVENVLALQD
jgi:hypothetical protein